ncbi:hypothetical protein [Trujillonella endophytica]|uniref:hypothetical protein n=1 Tax=Trujillonella endophytica TaxID=673521 RepID=UPI0011143BB7|nr:hypothetical protein [Trujillella endophytica]
MQQTPAPQGVRAPDDAADGLLAALLLGLLWVAWVLVPVGLLLAGLGETLTFFGEAPTAAEKARARERYAWAAVVALVLPAIGLVVSLRARRRVHAIAFGCALTVAGVVALGVTLAAGYADPDEAPQPERGVVCQERSGGDSDCPGG